MTENADLLSRALHDRYRISRRLGEGGMATVYLAHDVRHDREVAIKVLKPELARALGSERFLREVRIAARLNHPHILPLHDSGEADGFLYYVMPFMKGESLRERLSREGELPVADAVRILREMADALAHAHAEGVVHRDIKPDNVMLSGRHALVTDFGVAKAVSEATGRNEMTTAGVALGTPSYMAPEQAAADPNVDHRADIYALGALAYELLTGRPPFAGNTPQMILAAHITEIPQPVTSLRAVPEPLSAAVTRCLEKKPADRFQSSEELVSVFEALEMPSGGHTPTTAAAAGVGPRRNSARWWAAAAAGIALTLVVGGVALTRAGSGASVDRRSIAVLPLTNTSGDRENDAFTNGLHDDLLTQISKIADLRVTSRTSVMEYRSTTKNMRQIGQELDVATILEGGVQRAGNQVRVNAQLIDARTDEHLWAENYSRELTAANIFAIQSEIAAAIARALEARLSAADREALQRTPTQNLEAYEHYLTGLATGYWDSDTLAYTEFEAATQLDPTFVEAWAALSRAYAWHHRRQLALGGEQQRIEYARRSRAALQRAIALDSTLLETRLAQAYAEYYLDWDFVAALEHLEPLSERFPNNADLHMAIALQYRRLGRMEEALERLQRARRLNPRDPQTTENVAETLAMLGRFDEARSVYRSARTSGLISPDGSLRYATLLLKAFGDTALARQVIDSVATQLHEPGVAFATGLYLTMTGDTANASRWWDDVGHTSFMTLYAASVQQAVHPEFRVPVTGLTIEEQARSVADSVRRAKLEGIYDPVSRVDRYNVGWMYGHLAAASAVLGRADQAADALNRFEELVPRSFDAADYPGVVTLKMDVYHALGLWDELIDLLGDHPRIFPVGQLRLDRRFDPVRNDPRFQAVLRRVEARLADNP